MKKGKQKIISLLLALAMLTSLTGCSNPTGGNSEGSSSQTDTTPEGHVRADYQVNADVTALNASSEISDTLYGIFFEDINFAVDGGLYAEMIKNRSFEYGSLAANGSRHGWVNSNSNVLDFKVVNGNTDNSWINSVNINYAVLSIESDEYEGLNKFESIGNVGYLDGLAVTKDENYIVSLYIRGNDNYSGAVRIALEDSKGTVYAEKIIEGVSDKWWKYEVTLTPNATVDQNLRLTVGINKGSVALDMISMMPEDTYEGLPIRKDIGEALEALNPSFIRFPGGCAVEGRDESSMYSWKDSIGDGMFFQINGTTTVGDVAVRPQGVDIWSGDNNNPYYTTYGIGFFEYFQLCEALDALPVPILNAGMTCPIQSSNYQVYDINSPEFLRCVQDALDLVEFCRGDASTYWGSIRIAMGQEEPFELKYIGIGNEQWQSEYYQHYTYFVEAFERAAKANPEIYEGIELIVANGPVSTDRYGYNYVASNPDDWTTLVDEHYYEVADWFFTNTSRYDSYDRDMQAAVFLGEYAAKANTMNAALAEAAFMTGLERNADIVKMACYAPLFGNSYYNQWTPDMMFFSNDSLLLSANYYVQQLFANNVGVNVLPSTLEVDDVTSSGYYSGKVGLGSWATSVSYDNLKVVSNEDASVLYETNFDSDSVLTDDNWLDHAGNWSIKDGRLVQTNTASPSDSITGDVMYVGDTGWTNYTLTVNAKILSGAEGFLIPICVDDKDNNIFWNLGGWGNTVSCLEIVTDGVKSGQVSGTVKDVTLKQGQEYEIKIVVNNDSIVCFLDGKLYINYQPATAEPLYETTSIDENGDIIMKFVNPTESIMDIHIELTDIDMNQYDTAAIVTTLASERLMASNSNQNPDLICPIEGKLEVSESFVYEAPKYSVTIIRIPHK